MSVVRRLPHLLDTRVFRDVNFRLAQAEQDTNHRSGRVFQLTPWCDPTTVGALSQPYATSNSIDVRREFRCDDRVQIPCPLGCSTTAGYCLVPHRC
jgi:hypothetical protein